MNDERMRMLCMIIASVFAVAWTVLLWLNRGKYKYIIEGVRKSSKKHFFADLLLVGFNIMELLKLRGASDRSIRLKKYISDNHGDKYVDYYYLTIRARQFTIGFTTIPLAFTTMAIQTNSYIVLFVIALAFVFIADGEYEEKKLHDSRKEEILNDFPRVISKLTLLVSAGMPLREAWRRVSVSGKGIIYDEMQETIREMQNGTMELQSYKNFGARCDVKEIQKFTSMLIQNMQKGSGELTQYMRDLSTDMWTMRKDAAKKKGDKAASMLLAPITLIFIGILIMVIGPAMAQISI